LQVKFERKLLVNVKAHAHGEAAKREELLDDAMTVEQF
jgi:hypothetical protein